MSLLTIVANAQTQLGLTVSTSVISNTDPIVVQMLGLLAAELDAERSRHDWTALITNVAAASLTATSGIASYTLPTDFKRLVPNGEIWHVAQRRAIQGPVSSSDWQSLTVGTTLSSSAYWRRLGTILKFAGVTTGDEINYDYISKYPVATSGGTAKAAFTVDTDVSLMPENLAELGLMWRYLQAKGLPYAEEMANYEREIERATVEDRGAIRPILLARTFRGPDAASGSVGVGTIIDPDVFFEME